MKRIGVSAAILLTLLVLAGCAPSQAASSDPFFSRTRIGLDSVDGQVGQLRLLSVSIASPGPRGSIHLAGDSAALLLTVANDGGAEDVLIGVRAEAARQVVFRTGDASPNSHLHVVVSPGAAAVLREVTGPHLELEDLNQTLRSGFSVPVTFQFRDAGTVTLEVPIRTYDDVRPDKFSTP
jgi:copper(I)-binding protein